MDFQSAVSFLGSLNSYERDMPARYGEEDFDLRKFREFLGFAGIGLDGIKFVHVAGSKGKGTVCRILSDYLVLCGEKVGLYASPHVYDVRERILLNGKMIDEKRFAEEVGELKGLMERFSGELTYFEFLTALMFKVFVAEKVDFAIVETGLGGRLDSTNVIDEKLAVITRIEKEHTGILGDSYGEIVREKLGIVKGNPVVVGPQNQEVEMLVRGYLKDDKEVYFVDEEGNGFAQNLMIAKKVLNLMLEEVDELKLAQLVAEFQMPGRYEKRFVFGREVIFDMAHTKESVENLMERVSGESGGKKLSVLIALLKDKDVKGIMEILNRYDVDIYVCGIEHERAFDVEVLAGLAENLKGKFSDSFEGLKAMVEGDGVFVVMGSVYLLAEVNEKIPRTESAGS